MNRFYSYILACAALLACEGPVVLPEPEKVNEPEDLAASFPQQGLLDFAVWGEEDYLSLNGVAYSIASGAGTRDAVFDAKQPEGRYFCVSYPGEIASLEDFLSFSYEDRDEDLPFSVYMEDVDTCGAIVLSAEWAEAHGGRFRSSGLLEFRLRLPADIGPVRRVAVDGGGARFPANNEGTAFRNGISRSFDGLEPTDGIVTVAFTVPEKEFTLPAQGLKIAVTGENKTYGGSAPAAVSMGGARKTVVDMTDLELWSPASAVLGQGTENEPYILKSAEDLVAMHDLVEAKNTVWFELGADIDMASVTDWLPLNIAGSYDYYIHFDGKDHTISNFSCRDMKYTSFFGVVVGTVQNVTFDHPDVRHTSTGSIYTLGIIGGYAGTKGGLQATVENVHVTNGFITTPAAPTGDAFPMGGLFGIAANSTIRGCSFDGRVENNSISSKDDAELRQSHTGGIIGTLLQGCTVSHCSVSGEVMSTKSRYTGGIVGCMQSRNTLECCWSTAAVSGNARYVGGIAGGMKESNSIIRNCWSGGSVTCTNDQQAAGIVGEMLTLQTVSCCYSTAVVSAMRSAAGIVGRASNGTWKYGESHANTVEKCIAWNPSVTANEAGTDKGSSGAVVGFTSTQNTLSACWRNQAMSFKGSDTAHNVLADQPDCSPAEPFSKNTPGMYGSYCWPYHGKAAGTGDTVSSIALQLEWSAEAWDFTNDLPTIKAL